MNIVGAEIHNFQSHDKTKVKFENGINVFVGTSDSGKSAILRALKWNLMNVPSGDEFIREGTKEAAVTIYFEDGHSVERRRSKGGTKNSYTLFKDGEILEEYTGFGGKVPGPILEVTRIDPDFSFNFANQLEAPFLLSDSPKVRAETIGNLEELGKIDSELTVLNQDVRDKKAEQRSTKTRMAEIEKERNELLKELNVSRVKAETIEELKGAIIEKSRIYDVIKKSADRIRHLESEIVVIRELIERAQRVLSKWDEQLVDHVYDMKRLEAILSRLVQLKSEASLLSYMNEEKLVRLTELSGYATEIVASYNRLVQLKNYLERNTDEEGKVRTSYSAKVSQMDMKAIDVEVARFTSLFSYNNRLLEIEKTKRSFELQLKESTVGIDRLLTEFVSALQEAEVCPTCLQVTTNIDEHQLAHTL